MTSTSSVTKFQSKIHLDSLQHRGSGSLSKEEEELYRIYKQAMRRIDAIADLPTADGTFPNHFATWTSPTPERIYDVIENPRNRHRGMRRLQIDGISPTLTAHITKDGREYLHGRQKMSA
ncbi:hypothetical protein D3C74_393130 [compost metagenome]